MLFDSRNHHLVNCPWPDGINSDNNGLFRMDVARRISAVLDGTAQTAMASEVLAGKQDTRISGAMDYRGMWSWNMMGLRLTRTSTRQTAA